MHKIFGVVQIVSINDERVTFKNINGDTFVITRSHGAKMIEPLQSSKPTAYVAEEGRAFDSASGVVKPRVSGLTAAKDVSRQKIDAPPRPLQWASEKAVYADSSPKAKSVKPSFADLHFDSEKSLSVSTGWGARPYQTEALRSISSAFNRYNQVILALPTGSGKTFVAVKWACDHIISGGGKVIWVAHRTELLDQAYSTFVKLLPPHMSSEITWWAGGKEKNPHGRVVLVSISSANAFPSIETDLLVIDEAHHEPAHTYQKFQKTIHYKRNLGLTATPKRLDEKSLNYQAIAYQKTFMSLVNEKWLSRPDPVLPRTGMRYDLAVRMDDFSEESLRSLVTAPRNEFIANHWYENADKYQKVLVFAINRDHAKQLTECFRRRAPDKNVDYIVSGEGSLSDRKTKVSLFKNGEIDILINCKIFTEGFDCPDVKTIFITRPTLSVALYLQMIGRGTRITPEKNSFYLVDFQDDLGKFQNQLVSPWVLGDNIKEAVTPQPRESKTEVDESLPQWLHEDVKLEPVDMSLISGYVLYKHENGREDGFIVHAEDEERFLIVWKQMIKYAESHDEKAMALAGVSAHNKIDAKRIPLQGIIGSAIALVSGNAEYIKLNKEVLYDKIFNFLTDVEITEDDKNSLKKQSTEIHAVLKFKLDEIEDDLHWCVVFKNETKEFNNAVDSFKDKTFLRGMDLKNEIRSIYNNHLIDTQVLEYYWERFCLNNIKNPQTSVLYLEN